MDSTVLVVDDEENLLVLLDRILSKEGYRVITANNAYKALDSVDKGDIRAAIVDIQMYPINGVLLLAEIRRRSPSTQVIMMTAFPTTDRRNDCLKYGATKFLTKPLEISKLKTVLGGVLGK
jgi:DNA-binding NtrC family response regulator